MSMVLGWRTKLSPQRKLKAYEYILMNKPTQKTRLEVARLADGERPYLVHIVQ